MGPVWLMFDDPPTNVFKLLLNLSTQYSTRSGMCSYECDGFITNLSILGLSQVSLSVEFMFVFLRLLNNVLYYTFLAWKYIERP